MCISKRLLLGFRTFQLISGFSQNPWETTLVRHFYILTILGASIVLGGCAQLYDEWQESNRRDFERQQEQHRQYIAGLEYQCAKNGVSKGSREMDGCVARLQQIDAQINAQNEANARAAYAQSLQNAARIVNESTRPVMVPPQNNMNCRSYRNGNEIITNCR